MHEISSAGIVAEYNPFHNGHLWHIQETRRITGAEVILVVMSGNFIQRGEMAMEDKWSRAARAVRNGADLVVELPTVFAVSSAGNFARAGVNILQNLGADYISFGSESGDISALLTIKDKLQASKEEMEQRMLPLVKEGFSWPRARQQVLKGILNEEEQDMLQGPNHILALEYLKYMDKAKPVTVKRQGAGYHDPLPSGGFASATAIRQMAASGLDVSGWVPDDLQVSEGTLKNSKEIYFRMVAQKILSTPAEVLDLAEAGGEGLGNKARNEIRRCRSMEDFYETLKSKRYTRTRIQRFAAQILLGITKEDVNAGMDYVRVLALNERGSRYLKAVKKAGICQIPVITNVNRDLEKAPEIEDLLRKDMQAADLYNLASGRNMYEHCDMVERVRFFKENT